MRRRTAMARPEEVDHGNMHGKIYRLKVDRPNVTETDHKTGKTIPTPLKVGDIVKVVMVSRFGDCGITTDLKREFGYSTRVQPEDLEEVITLKEKS